MKTRLLLALLIASATSHSQPVPSKTANTHKLQIGLAAVSSQSSYIAGNHQTRVFPAIDYQYKRFYFQAGDLGFKLAEKNNWALDFGVGTDLAGDTDRGDSPLLTHLPHLSLSLSAFLTVKYTSPIGLFKIKHSHEINNKHEGYSNSLSYAAPIRRGQWLIMPQLSYEQHSEEAVNYYFGVNNIDATDQIPFYQTGAVDNFKLSVLALRPINTKWSFVGSIQNEFYGDEISDSPVIDDDQRLSMFVGLLYKVF